MMVKIINIYTIFFKNNISSVSLSKNTGKNQIKEKIRFIYLFKMLELTGGLIWYL